MDGFDLTTPERRPATDPPEPEWAFDGWTPIDALIRNGRTIEAIREYRIARPGTSLSHAKRDVEARASRIVPFANGPLRRRSGALTLRVLALVAVVGLIVVLLAFVVGSIGHAL